MPQAREKRERNLKKKTLIRRVFLKVDTNLSSFILCITFPSEDNTIFFGTVGDCSADGSVACSVGNSLKCVKLFEDAEIWR